jgi:crotonobetainyl-CoA:carnitine CoA-transferase CaiB-like acyl-CoA transferase
MSANPQPSSMQPTPELGEHTAEVLAGLGYDAKAVADLRRRGIV